MAEKTMELREAFCVIAVLTQHSRRYYPFSFFLLLLSVVTCIISPALFAEIKVSYTTKVTFLVCKWTIKPLRSEPASVQVYGRLGRKCNRKMEVEATHKWKFHFPTLSSRIILNAEKQNHQNCGI